jgi:hypothetical protein
VFSWSYRALGPAAARLFRLVGLHPGPDVTAAASASLTGVPEEVTGVPAEQVGHSLAELVRAHLLTEHTPGRYACHDLLRAYASELARAHDSDDERRAAVHRMLDHDLHSAYMADRVLNPNADSVTLAACQAGVSAEVFSDHAAAMAWFAAEKAVLLAVVDHGSAGVGHGAVRGGLHARRARARLAAAPEPGPGFSCPGGLAQARPCGTGEVRACDRVASLATKVH